MRGNGVNGPGIVAIRGTFTLRGLAGATCHLYLAGPMHEQRKSPLAVARGLFESCVGLGALGLRSARVPFDERPLDFIKRQVKISNDFTVRRMTSQDLIYKLANCPCA